jgi:fibronectin type 3 domain-containing protein
LSGTGVAAVVAHSAALSWTESSGSVSGYNVYRSTQSGTGYTQINSGLVASQAYTDTTVSGGQTYYYVVTSVNSGGVQSAYSPQVTAAVPTT